MHSAPLILAALDEEACTSAHGDFPTDFLHFFTAFPSLNVGRAKVMEPIGMAILTPCRYSSWMHVTGLTPAVDFSRTPKHVGMGCQLGPEKNECFAARNWAETLSTPGDQPNPSTTPPQNCMVLLGTGAARQSGSSPYPLPAAADPGMCCNPRSSPRLHCSLRHTVAKDRGCMMVEGLALLWPCTRASDQPLTK